MARLTKRDVEALLDGYDADHVAALTAALCKVLDVPRSTSWPDLVAMASFPTEQRDALLAGRQAALDALAQQLNEERDLSRSGR